MAIKWLTVGSVYNVDTLDRRMIHIPGTGSGTQDASFLHDIQNGVKFRTYELFISQISHLMFSNYGWPQVTEIAESKTVDKGRLLYNIIQSRS